MINIFSNKYPYTDYHELNLDWLLDTYQTIIDHVNELFTWMAEHKQEYTEAMERLAAVETEIDTFEKRVEKLFDELRVEQEEAFRNQQDELNNIISRNVNEMRELVSNALNEFETRFTQLQLDTEREITALKLEVQRTIIWLNSSLDANNEYIFKYVENRLDIFLRDFPTLANIPVYNPVRGVETGLQLALNDLYELSRFGALTAYQYDSLGLTASEYDNRMLTALEYDQDGYKLLGYPDENYYMINPFTGRTEKVKNVVYYLASLHMNGLTADEYDAYELDADTYDGLLLSAYDYDTMGRDVINV